MRVDIEDIRRVRAERKKFNDFNFDEIEWYEDGKKVEINRSLKLGQT